MAAHHLNNNGNGNGRRGSSPRSAAAIEKLERGMALHSGVAGRPDPLEAARLFVEAAETGDPAATLWLARLRWRGMLGFDRDRDLAREMATPQISGETERLAIAGDAQAAFVLGSALFDGLIGLDGRVAQALAMFARAAEGGHAGAAYNMGYIWAKGLGVKSDPAKAVSLYRQAADRGHPKAMFKLGRACNGGFGTRKDRARALEWFREAAQRGHAGAMFRLGLAFARGSGVEKNEEAALEWYRQAARAGLADAQDALLKRRETWQAE